VEGKEQSLEKITLIVWLGWHWQLLQMKKLSVQGFKGKKANK